MNYTINETPISITTSREEFVQIYGYVGHAIYTVTSFEFYTKLGYVLQSSEDASNHTFTATCYDIYKILEGMDRSHTYNVELKDQFIQLKHTLKQQGRWNPNV